MANEIAPPEPDLPKIRRHVRRSPIWRLFGWGSAACLALAGVALTSQTEAGSKRLQFALAYTGEPVQVVAKLLPRAADSDAETKRLTAQLRDLTADRDRLTARIATLEHNLEDMTGSIKRQSEQIAAARTANVPPPAPNTPATAPAVVAMPTLPAPAGALTPLPRPAAAESSLPWFLAMRTPQAADPPVPPEALEAAAEPVSLPPVRVAAAPASVPAEQPPPPPAKDEFGIDLGGAATIETLRVHWASLKANYGPLLSGLNAVVAQHPKRPTGVTYRLVAGPLPNAEEAARLCARFPAMGTGCHPAKFEGAQLAAH
ncbi:MAG: hypothetical protein ABSF41_06445 [Pseudolabrys sp.]|jgi:hypothetical protein